jgi:hypothetical protein
MRLFSATFLIVLGFAAFGCSGEKAAATPVETFKIYVKAMKAKDITTMKLLLSNETIKMHEQEAKAQNVTLDDIVKRETLVGEDQKQIEFRNEKIDGQKATLEIKNGFGQWETLPFVFEDDAWKIDKKGYADNFMKEIEQQQNDAFGIPAEDMTSPNAQPPDSLQ